MHSFTYQDRGLWFKQKVSLPEVPPPSLPSAGQPGSRRCWEGWIQVPSQTLRLKWDIYKKKGVFLRKSHWKVAKDAGPAGPSVPPLWHSKSGAFSAFSTLISTSEDGREES